MKLRKVKFDFEGFKAICKAQGKNHVIVRDMAGIDQSCMSRINRGIQKNIGAELLYNLAKQLDVPMERLLKIE